MSFPTLAQFESAAEAHGLADTAHYTPAAGNARAIVGKFISDYVEPFGLSEAVAPVFRCALAQFEAGDPKQDDALELVRLDGGSVSRSWKIKTVKRDTPQVGECLLILKKA